VKENSIMNESFPNNNMDAIIKNGEGEKLVDPKQSV
jgi:hypothetical protein